LFQRSQTGVGTTVEASLFDSATGFLGYFLQGYWERGTEPERPGSGHESLCPYEAFETRDTPLILGVANDGLWRAFCAVSGLQDVVADPRFATNAARVAHREETVAMVRRVLVTRGRDEWIELLGAVGIPCSPLHTLGELSAHPHTAASGMVFDYDDEKRGPLRAVAQPLRFEGERTALRRPPPTVGQHGREVLREAGYSDAEIDAMGAAGVVALPD
jgi:crotonobetainyl-CoA:carnitine CoA-transferase CaiB-like acyl-CoA transferase